MLLSLFSCCSFNRFIGLLDFFLVGNFHVAVAGYALTVVGAFHAAHPFPIVHLDAGEQLERQLLVGHDGREREVVALTGDAQAPLAGVA